LTWDHREAGHQLLGLRERPVEYGRLPAREHDPRALRRWLQAGAIQHHHAGLDHLFTKFVHGGHLLGGWKYSRLGLLGRLDQYHASHRRLSSSVRVLYPYGERPEAKSTRG